MKLIIEITADIFPNLILKKSNKFKLLDKGKKGGNKEREEGKEGGRKSGKKGGKEEKLSPVNLFIF